MIWLGGRLRSHRKDRLRLREIFVQLPNWPQTITYFGKVTTDCAL